MSNILVETPLHHMADAFMTLSGGGINIHEADMVSHLNLRGCASDSSFMKAAQKTLGFALPVVPNSFSGHDESAAYWLGPDEWLITTNDIAVEDALRVALKGHFAVTNITGGQTIISLRGGASLEILQKSSIYDFHPSKFKVGNCVQTTFAKAGALVVKKADGSFNLIIRRSFADYIGRWLLDAAREYS